MRCVFVMLCVCSVIGVAGCGAAQPAVSPPTTNPSGIEGQVLIGPACPGPVSLATPCPDKPYQAAIVVRDQSGKEVQQFETDTNGHFRVILQPGEYTLVPQAPGALPHAGEQVVTVTSGQFTPVTITYDSGIR